jgi:deazaflavin-dependent oxidoreductase (nitroreductase family)
MPVDRLLGKLTGGRSVAFGLGELPSMILTTTGRRTGQPRDVPLLYTKDGDGYLVIGSNWGRHEQPAWSGNLLAHPDAVMAVGGRRIPVRARLVTGAERERDLAALLAMWPAYATYEIRAGGRELRLFRLEPVD